MVLYTIGYSEYFEGEGLINRLKELNIEYLVDVRTFPYSKTFPYYDEPILKKELAKVGIKHQFLGDYVGGLTVKTKVREGIKTVKDLLEVEQFKNGMNKLYKIIKSSKTAIMCAEKDPMNCHRFLGIGYLMETEAGVKVVNVIGSKEEDIDQTINRFKKENKLENLNFSNEQIIKERLNLLYKIQNKKEERELPKIGANKTLF